MKLRTKWREYRIAKANNISRGEGHLGGYIPASNTPTPSGLNVENGDPATWSPQLWHWIFDALGVRSVLDVGCGEGHCARFFAGLGCQVLGVDGSVKARRDSVIPQCHEVHDFVSGPFQPPRSFDLVWSCEFVEHVEEKYASHFLTTFRSSSRFIMMTYAAPGQPGWHHVNCRPADYWIEKLAAIGYTLDTRLTKQSRQLAEEGHFRSRGLVFCPESLVD